MSKEGELVEGWPPISLNDYPRTARGQALLDQAQEARRTKRAKDPVWAALDTVDAMSDAASCLDGTEPALATKLRQAVNYVLDEVAHLDEFLHAESKKEIMDMVRTARAEGAFFTGPDDEPVEGRVECPECGAPCYADDDTYRYAAPCKPSEEPIRWMVTRDSHDRDEVFDTEAEALRNATLGPANTHVIPLYRLPSTDAPEEVTTNGT